MKRLHALSLATIFMVFGQTTGRAQQAPPPPPLDVMDVSPGAPFGTQQDSNGVDPSGRVLSLVIDPTNDSILYAASTFSGIWKSENAGRTWHQASSGLRNGYTRELNAPVLAIDAQNPQRLLYATDADDGRPGTPYGGLWVSMDGAASWLHVEPCTTSRNLYSVVFGGGRPFVATDCGIMTTSDPDLTHASSWSTLPGKPPFSNGASLATWNERSTLFACQGRNVYMTLFPFSTTPDWQTVGIPGACYGLMAVVPPSQFELAPSSLLVMYDRPGTDPTGKPTTIRDVGQVNFNTGGVSSLNFAESNPPSCCGVAGVFVAQYRTPLSMAGPGPLKSYDIYAEDGFSARRFHLNFQWQPLTGLHVDSWSMAFPAAYDPYNGNCTAYAANDGGVFTNTISGTGNCITNGAENGWILASSGLHLYASEAMTGLSQPATDCVENAPCPILYDPAADDEVWVSAQGGYQENSWEDLRAQISDAAQVFVDPALSTHVVSGRFGGGGCEIRLQTSRNNAPATPANIGTSICIDPPNFGGGVQTPRLGGFSQAMTLPTEAPLPFGDYFAIESPYKNQNSSYKCPSNSSSCDDLIVRNIRGEGGTWEDISPSAHFGPGWVGQIAASGGHTNPAIYVLTTNDPQIKPAPIGGNGFVWKGQVDSSGKVVAWTQASGILPQGLVRAYNLVVNPYDPNELYATDLSGEGAIKTSRDGGQTWSPVPELKDIATNHGEFVFDCGDFANGGAGGTIFQGACPLVDMAFNRDHPEIRVAALFPGGIAFSRDSGHHWLPLNVTNAQPYGSPQVFDLIEMPRSVFYDLPTSRLVGSASIYIALQGKGIIRVRGPFSTLMSGQAIYCCETVTTEHPSQIGLVVPTMGLSIPLRPGSNGSFTAEFLFDSAKYNSFSYYFTVNGVPTQTLTRTLSPAEIASGVALVDHERHGVRAQRGR